MGTIVYGLHHIRYAVISQNRQQRAKYFLLHDLIIPCHMIQHSRCNAAFLRLPFATANDFFRHQQSAQTQKMFFVDNSPIVVIFQRLFPKLLSDFLYDGLYQLIMHTSLTINIVGRYTGLPAVQKFAEHDAFCRQLDFGGAVHNAGTLPTQLQRHRRQMLSGLPHHFLTHRLTAGKKDIIKGLLQQAAVFLPSAGHHRHISGVKTFCYQLLQHRTGMGRIGAGL